MSNIILPAAVAQRMEHERQSRERRAADDAHRQAILVLKERVREAKVSNLAARRALCGDLINNRFTRLIDRPVTAAELAMLLSEALVGPDAEYEAKG